jgi:uncharacterized repeat protein (TIGR03943 family)
MRPTPFSDRRGLFAAVYLAWWITLLSFVVSGEYRNFIQPSFVVFLWLALATLLIFALAELRQLGSAQVRICDVVRCGFLALPLFALWLANGQTLDSQAYLKRAVTTGQRAGTPGDGPIHSGKAFASRPSSESEPLQVTILDILQNPKEFEGKWVETEGMALREETMRKDKSMRQEAIVHGTFVLFRFSILCCVADSQPLGLIVAGADPKDLVDSDWYRVVGRFVINKDQMGTISQAVVSRLKTPPESPYLYGSQNLYQGTLQNQSK